MGQDPNAQRPQFGDSRIDPFEGGLSIDMGCFKLQFTAAPCLALAQDHSHTGTRRRQCRCEPRGASTGHQHVAMAMLYGDLRQLAAPRGLAQTSKPPDDPFIDPPSRAR